MFELGADNLHRRGFLQAGAATAVTALAATSGASGLLAAQDDKNKATKSAVLPTRPLGKTGASVTIVNHGTFQNPATNRLVKFSYANGVRYFDTAKSYGSEPDLAKWFDSNPEVRKQIFLVTKDSPRSAKDLLKMLDQRLANLKTDYIDMLFIHALGDHSAEDGITWPKDKEFKEIFETIRKSGKAKFVGFSTHHARRAEILQSAAEGGFVDGIMLQYSPFLEKDSALNKAIDACHKKGIGLVSMKQLRGMPDANNPYIKTIYEKMPELKEKGLTPYQALLTAIWSDERISSVCVSMKNVQQVEENTTVARSFKEPMKAAEIDRLRDALAHVRRTMCPDCDGRCAHAAGTQAKLGDLTRILSYHEHDGARRNARELYAELAPEAKDWAGADLVAAQQACPHNLDFASLLPKVDRCLA